jgi:Asp-tRNA(Asn)/Glu-tRNA(Gln) amidotransferase C subunit
MPVDRETVRRIARLARLALAENHFFVVPKVVE